MPGSVLPVHTHNLSHYINQASDQTHAVRSLIKQLNTVTEGVDPEQGFARSLLDLSWRMKNSANVLKADLRHAHAPKLPQVREVAKSSVGIVFPIDVLSRRKLRYNAFL